MQSGMFGSSGAAQARAMQQQQPLAPQPSVPPLSSSQPSLRAQVPQFISPQVRACTHTLAHVQTQGHARLSTFVFVSSLPQVQAQLLQFAAKNIGLNPALLTSPINPQHMTLLNQLYQLQLVSSILSTTHTHTSHAIHSSVLRIHLSNTHACGYVQGCVCSCSPPGLPAFTNSAADVAGPAQCFRPHPTTRAASQCPSPAASSLTHFLLLLHRNTV